MFPFRRLYIQKDWQGNKFGDLELDKFASFLCEHHHLNAADAGHLVKHCQTLIVNRFAAIQMLF